MLFNEDPMWPGAIFSESPMEVPITPMATKIEGKGITLSFPENSMEREESLNIATSFSGAFEIPDDLESVSPAYMIGTTTTIEFSKDVDLKLQHTANLRTAEDCKDMVVMKASIVPSNDGSRFSRFQEIKDGSVKFIEEGRFGVVKLRSLVSSSYKIGRKKKEEGTEGKSCGECFFNDFNSYRREKAVLFSKVVQGSSPI